MIEDYNDDEVRMVLQDFGELLAKHYDELPSSIQELLEEHFCELIEY